MLDECSHRQEVLLIPANSEHNCQVGKIYLWVLTFSVLKDFFISKLILPKLFEKELKILSVLYNSLGLSVTLKYKQESSRLFSTQPCLL